MTEISYPNYQLEKKNRLGNWVHIYTSESFREVNEEIEVFVETGSIPRANLRIWKVERTLMKG